MNNIIKLPDYYEDCPQWWKSFVKNTNRDRDSREGKDVRAQILKRYNAIVVRDYSGNVDHIKFEREEHKTWFLLNIQIDENFK